MIVHLPADSAMALAAVGWSASTDKDRPILTGINLAWDSNLEDDHPVLTATATDSYQLAHRRIMAAEFVQEGDDRDHGSVIVPAKQLMRAVKERVGTRINTAVTIILDSEAVIVMPKTDPANAVSIPKIDGTFPQYRTLFGYSWNAPSVESDLTPTDGPVDPIGINPTVFNTMGQAAWCKRGSGKKQHHLPLRMVFSPDKAPLKPVGFVTTDQTIGPFRGIAMPVRM